MLNFSPWIILAVHITLIHVISLKLPAHLFDFTPSLSFPFFFLMVTQGKYFN